MRPFQLARLAAEDQEVLAAAAEMKGLDEEIALLRVLIRRAAGRNFDAARLAIESLIRALLAQKELQTLPGGGVGGRLEAVLDKLAAEEGDEEIPPLPSPFDKPSTSLRPGLRASSPPPGGREQSPPSSPVKGEGASSPSLTLPRQGGGDEFWPAARPAAHTAVGEGQILVGEQVGLEAEAVGLVLRHQAGEPEAMELLHRLLKPAMVAVLLNELAFQPPAELSVEELEAESARVLDELARRWGPGVSFLGYFMRTYPSAMAHYAREGRRSGGRGRRPKTPPLPHPRSPGGREGSGPPLLSPPLPGGREFDLEGLPEVERQIFVLRALEGQSMRGIARRVGVPEMAAYKLYERARQRLGGKIGALEGAEWIALTRLVEALHAAAGAGGRLPGRGWAMAAAGLKRIEYDQLIGRLEAAGAIEGRRGRQQPGRLVEWNAAATLARVAGPPSP